MPLLRISIVLAAVVCFHSAFAAYRDVEGETKGTRLDTIAERPHEEPIRLMVSDTGYMWVVCCKGIMKVEGLLREEDLKDCTDAVRAGITWFQKASDGNIQNIDKVLGMFWERPGGVQCGVAVSFRTPEDAMKGYVSLDLHDVKVKTTKLQMRLNKDQAAELVALFEKVPKTISELKENVKKLEAIDQDAAAKARDDAKAKAKDDAKVKADAAAKARLDAAPTFILKDGRKLKALSSIESGESYTIKDESGKFIELKKSEIVEVQKPGEKK